MDWSKAETRSESIWIKESTLENTEEARGFIGKRESRGKKGRDQCCMYGGLYAASVECILVISWGIELSHPGTFLCPYFI